MSIDWVSDKFSTFVIDPCESDLDLLFVREFDKLGGEIGRKKKNFADFIKILKVLIISYLMCEYTYFYFLFRQVTTCWFSIRYKWLFTDAKTSKYVVKHVAAADFSSDAA